MKWIFNIIDVFGFLLTFIGTYLAINSDKSADVLSTGLTGWSWGLTFIFAVGWYHYFHCFMIARSVLKGRSELQQVYRKSVELNKSGKIKLDEGLNKFKEICQHVSAAMRRFHSSEISVCIHYTSRDDSKQYVKILARNTDSERKRSRLAGSVSSIDYIDANTDFETIIWKVKNLSEPHHYYFNNFLPFSFNYKNSHFPARYNKSKWKKIFLEWPLLYRSTIVVPIKKRENNKLQICGFLSVDSDRMYSFSRKYDLPILQEIAETIAPIVESYSRTHL